MPFLAVGGSLLWLMSFKGIGHSTAEDSQPREGKEDHQPRQYCVE